MVGVGLGVDLVPDRDTIDGVVDALLRARREDSHDIHGSEERDAVILAPLDLLDGLGKDDVVVALAGVGHERELRYELDRLLGSIDHLVIEVMDEVCRPLPGISTVSSRIGLKVKFRTRDPLAVPRKDRGIDQCVDCMSPARRGHGRQCGEQNFPGYRSRKREHLQRSFRDATNAPAEYFLRGKVDYLFQSYTADLELTSLVLCLPDSNLEVATLPKAIENWIDVTHGTTPDRRSGKPTLLFFALTKFDRHLMELVGEEGNPLALRFETRLEASLLGPFAKSDASWPKQWTPGAAFQNLFWIRNPNFRSEHVIRYEGRQEVEVLPERRERIAKLRDAFIGSPLARTYFRDPTRAWDEVMRLNDGGIGYLAEALGVVSTPDLKLRQVGSRLLEVRREVAEALKPYYVDDDYAKRRAQRLEVVDTKIFGGLNGCAERMAFGSALRGMMVDASDLYAAVSESLNRPMDTGPAGPFGRRGQDPQVDKWTRVANAALDRWTNMMFERSEDAAFSRRIGVGSDVLKELVVEFTAASRRADLAERIASFIRQNNSPNEQIDAIARKISLVAERRINRFVSQLDFDFLDASEQRRIFGDDLREQAFVPRKIEFDTLDMPRKARDFTSEFMSDWGEAFRTTVARNAMSATAGVDDPGQNAKLGEILKAIAA